MVDCHANNPVFIVTVPPPNMPASEHWCEKKDAVSYPILLYLCWM